MPKITFGITITGLSGNWGWDDGIEGPSKGLSLHGSKNHGHFKKCSRPAPQCLHFPYERLYGQAGYLT